MTSPYELSDDMPVYVSPWPRTCQACMPQTLRGYERVGLVTTAAHRRRGRATRCETFSRAGDPRLSQDEGSTSTASKRILDLERELEPHAADGSRTARPGLHAAERLESTRAVAARPPS